MKSILFTLENESFSDSFALFEVEKDMTVYLKEVDSELTTKEHSSFIRFSDIDELINALIIARNSMNKDSKLELIEEV